jgi:MGT family glycosyltransferase
MAHIAFVAPALTGHVNPTLPVVAELVRRGHRVSYATTGEYAERVTRTGARCIPYETTLRFGGQPMDERWSHAERFTTDDFVQSQRGQLREAAAVLPVLISAFGRDVPETVVYDPMTWVGRILAARWRVPAVKSVTTLVSGSGWSLGAAPTQMELHHPALPAMFAAISALLQRYESDLGADALFSTDDEIPVIAYHPRSFQVQAELFGPHVHFIGPCLPPNTPRTPSSLLSPSRSPQRRAVLVCFGTVFNRATRLLRICLEALADAPYRVVVALGGADVSTIDFPVPANTEVHRYLPLLDVLPQVDVLVSHAGMGSTMESLSCGVPVVAIPQMPEQRANAVRLAELGLGRHVEPAALEPQALRRTVLTIAQDSTVASRVGWMQDQIRRAPGPSGGADVIEEGWASRMASVARAQEQGGG